MLTYQTETFADVRGEAHALAQAHWNETEAAMYGARSYAMDEEQYERMEAAGALYISTVRHNGALVGYASFFVTYNMHLGCMSALLDGLFVHSTHRGMSGIKLLRHAQDALRQCGVGSVQYVSPASNDCGALYRRLGAEHTETVYTRVF